MAATLLDLGARGFVAIETRGDRTVVRLTSEYPAPQLAPHERLVLARVADLAEETADATVPAAALTLGPIELADPAWTAFERAVAGAARWAGMSRPRWSRAAKAGLVAGAVLAGLGAGAALAHGDPTTGLPSALAPFGLLVSATLGTLVVRLRGERDTAAGRAAADRWAGYAATLADDP